LIDGFFHADPHPGNVFLTDDGRIALLDWAMTGRLNSNMQEICCGCCWPSAKATAMKR